MKTITFYHEYEAFGWLSNYHVCDIELDGRSWKSTEHYYQAQKAIDEEMKEAIRCAPTPDDAKKLGNSETLKVRDDWPIHRIVAMRRALEAKFLQHKDLLALLFDTGDALLVEDSATDFYWGQGDDRSGRNMLGIMLSDLRNELRAGI